MLGLFYGFVFTVLPLLLIVWGIRRRRSGRMWLWILVGAGLLALPNLMTLGIMLGPGSGAHAGDRTLDVEAPGFRGATLGGVLLALAAIGFIWYLPVLTASCPGCAATAIAPERPSRAVGGQTCLGRTFALSP